MHPIHHALSSAKVFGGQMGSYLHVHHWFDASKAAFGLFRHRALRHHREGIAEAIALFGPDILASESEVVSLEEVGLQHLEEDLGIVADAADWLENLEPPAWMPTRRIPKAEELARLSARRFGGSEEEYFGLHNWFLATSQWFDDRRHLAMRHHAFGIFEAEARFGVVLPTASKRLVPTRAVAERHVANVLNRTVPTACQWLKRIRYAHWMDHRSRQKSEIEELVD